MILTEILKSLISRMGLIYYSLNNEESRLLLSNYQSNEFPYDYSVEFIKRRLDYLRLLYFYQRRLPLVPRSSSNKRRLIRWDFYNQLDEIFGILEQVKHTNSQSECLPDEAVINSLFDSLPEDMLEPADDMAIKIPKSPQEETIDLTSDTESID